jgi:hypothetical protein
VTRAPRPRNGTQLPAADSAVALPCQSATHQPRQKLNTQKQALESNQALN